MIGQKFRRLAVASCLALSMVTAGAGTALADPDGPTVVGVPDRSANSNGWYNDDVTIDWQATPQSGGISASDPTDTVASTEAQNHSYVSGSSCDQLSRCNTGSLSLSIDKTAPTIAEDVSINYHNNSYPEQFGDYQDEMPVSQQVSFYADASDALSGLTTGEYFVGTDPGVGSGTPVSVNSGRYTVNPYQPTTPGTYTVGIRARDRAGNWSDTSTAELVVTSDLFVRVSASGTIVPGGTSSDSGDDFPGIDGTTSATIGIGVSEQVNDADNADTMLGPVTLHYVAGNCAPSSNTCFDLTTLFFDDEDYYNEIWGLEYLTSDTSVITGGMLATIDGEQQEDTYAFRLEVIDGGASSPDHFLLKVWPDSVDPNDPGSEPPTFQASGDVSGSLVVQSDPAE